MTFYNRKIARNKALTKAWRAGHQMKSTKGDEMCLSEICEEITRWMRRSRSPRKRLSLRSFSILLSGAVRIYRDQVDLLLKDTFNCSIFKKSTTRTSDEEMCISESTVEESLEITSELVVARKTDSHTNRETCESIEYDIEEGRSPVEDFEVSMSDDDDNSTVFTVVSNDNQKSKEQEQKMVEKRDQITQTSPTPEQNNIREFDPNLPFGYVIIHENYHSRIPSKILFSSLNENIKLLPIQKPMN